MNQSRKESLYHYSECGLDNVYLKGGVVYRDTPYGKQVSIKDLDGLHKAIGLLILKNKKKMEPSDVKFLRLEMELSQARLAELMSVDVQTVARWEKGKTEMDGPADKLMRVISSSFFSPDETTKDWVREMNEIDRQVAKKLILKKFGDSWRQVVAK